MADMAVSFAREKLLPLIEDEANLLWNVPKEFADIKDELKYLQGFVQEADERAGLEGDNRNKGIKKWVEQLREASFRIEDVIDEYMMYVEQQPHESAGCASLLCEIIHFIETLVPRHRIASEIQQIKSNLNGIKQRGADYQFKIQPSFEQGSSSYTGSQRVQWHDPRLASRYLDEADVVGIEDSRDELIGWLVKGPEERAVISVVGMGGLGKTTLVSKVFNNPEVIGHFDFHVWITVSQSYIVEGLMRDLLMKLRKEKNKESPTQDIPTMDRDSLIDEVRDHLQQKRYVVVFDDVWGVQLWSQIENVVFDNKKGSRILITTRKMDVVDSCKNSPFDRVHELKPLTLEKSLELFYKKAFRFDYNGCCPDHLRDISLEIVNRCKGLPLAIVAIGGLLSKKKTFEWEKIKHSLSSELDKNPHLIGVTKILGLSYDDLPYYLQSCLLYFGVYPEDYKVGSKRLIRQWIAEGFVQEEEGKTLEDVAQQYLTELIGRSLVQVSSFTIDGNARSCHVHDLLYEMLLKKFKDLSFCQHISKEDESMSSGMIRRLSLATISNDLMGSTESLHTRSLLVFAGKESELTNNFVQKIPTKYRLLKVLDFEGGELDYVPENWGNLTHLKYLSLRSTSILAQSLPKFICKLQNLETLDIRYTHVKEMPKEICKLRKLRHLLGSKMNLFQLKNDLGGMTSLQTLCEVTMADDEEELIRELGKMKQLRKLYLIDVKEEQGSVLCSSLNEMKNLENLRVYSASSGDEVIDLHDISSLHMLRKLHIDGKLNKFLEWVPQLQNLIKLTLGRSKLTDDPLKSLQNMPHLLFLDIGYKAYEGESLYFQDGGFQQLKELHLSYLYNLNSIIIDKGALNSLKRLYFWILPKLKTVPHGIQHLKKLEVFHTNYLATEGLEHSIIQHVPLVKITVWRRGKGLKTRVIHHPRH